jgi:hypothetical protein
MSDCTKQEAEKGPVVAGQTYTHANSQSWRTYLDKNNVHHASLFSTFLIGRVLFRARKPSSFIKRLKIVSSFIKRLFHLSSKDERLFHLSSKEERLRFLRVISDVLAPMLHGINKHFVCQAITAVVLA